MPLEPTAARFKQQIVASKEGTYCAFLSARLEQGKV